MKVNKLSILIALLLGINIMASLPEGYQIETINEPKGMKLYGTGLAADDKGGVYLSSFNGDVWYYSSNKKWTLFAQGFNDPCGLLWEKKTKSLYVAHKNDLSRVLDSDNDGVWDKIQVISSSDWGFSGNYHEYHFGPVKDTKGNLYGTLNLSSRVGRTLLKSPMRAAAKYRGVCYAVDTKGQFVPFAWGFRSPCGIGISPKDEVFITDNQGDWVPTSTLMHVRKNHFYGHPVSLLDHPKLSKSKLQKMKVEDFDKLRTLPTIWLPHKEIANSPGNPVFDTTKGKFGPFSGQIFVGDQGLANIFRCGIEKVAGEYQGWCINFIDNLQAGVVRVAFDDNGALWAAQCSRGWRGKGKVISGLQKITFKEGKKVFSFHSMKLTDDGFSLSFTAPLKDKDISLVIKSWEYNYGPQYGSPKVKEANIDIAKVSLSKDKKTIFLKCKLETKRVYSFDLQNLSSLTGKKLVNSKVFYTLNKLKSDKIDLKTISD